MAVDGFDSTAVLFAWKNGTAVLLLMGRWQSLRAIAECNGPLAKPADDCLASVGHHHSPQPVRGVCRVEDVEGIGGVGAHVGGCRGDGDVGQGAGSGNVELVPAGIEAGVGRHFTVAHIGEGRVVAVLIADGHVTSR